MLAVDATHVYWVNEGKTEGSFDGQVTYVPGEVMAVGLDGGTPITLAANQRPPAGSASRPSPWTRRRSMQELAGGAVMSVSLGGGAPVTLATSADLDYGVAIDDTNVYWAAGQKGTGAIMSVPKGGGTAVALATGPWSPSALVSDATSLYLTTVEGDILKTAKP
jgi:hypothetical protein